MPELNLLGRLLARHAVLLGGCALTFGGFEFLICAFVSTFDLAGLARELTRSLPPFLQLIVGDQLAAFLSAPGLVAFGWDHPVAHVLGAAVAVILASRGVAGEIESGQMELVLGGPVRRSGYLGAVCLHGLGALAVLSLAGLAGTAAGKLAFGRELFGGANLFRLALNFFLLQAAWFGLTLACSAFGRENGRVAGIGFSLALVSYIGQAVGRLLPWLAWVLPYSLYSYFSPRAVLLDGRLAGTSVAVLAGVAAAGISLAFWRFARRDIP